MLCVPRQLLAFTFSLYRWCYRPFSMFVLTEMKDTIRVPPHHFFKKFNNAIRQSINTKLANKACIVDNSEDLSRNPKQLLEQVVHKLGLCIMLYDILDTGDSFILPGDGAYHCNVSYRYVIFRPFVGEVMLAKIRSSSIDGLVVSVGFFDDIFISSSSLQEPSRFDEKEQLWCWEYATDDGKHDLFLDLGQELRIRILSEEFFDTSPIGPQVEKEEKQSQEKQVPYQLSATISEPGLGLLSWWQ